MSRVSIGGIYSKGTKKTMRNITTFLEQVKAYNPNLSEGALTFLRKGYAAGLVQGRIDELAKRVDKIKEIERLLSDIHIEAQRGQYELIDYQDHVWPYKVMPKKKGKEQE